LQQLAGTGVQYLMGLFEALFYGSFLLIILIAIMPGCQRVLLSYVTSLVWIQSWPTIYTIINFFMTANTVAANNVAASFIGTDGVEGIDWNLFTCKKLNLI
jgi:conjugal transfer mating pair stabilization protein TraG